MRSRAWAAVTATLIAPCAFGAELAVRGPESCSDRQELSFRVSRLLAGSLEEVPELRFEVDISASSRGYRGHVRVFDGSAGEDPSERDIEETDCSSLMDALAVVIVLAINRVHATGAAAEVHAHANASAENDSVGEARSDQPPINAAPLDTGAVSATPASTPLSPSVTAWVLGDAGALPDPGLGLGLSFEIAASKLRFGAAGSLFPEQHMDLAGAGTPVPGAEVGLALGSLSACYAPAGSWHAELALGACLRGEAGGLYGTGENVRGARSASRWWIAPGLDLASTWSFFPALHASAQIGVTAPLLRTRFALGELGELYRPEPVTVRAAVGLGVVLE